MERFEAMLYIRLLQHLVINRPDVRTKENAPAIDMIDEALNMACEDLEHMDNLSHIVVNLKDDLL